MSELTKEQEQEQIKEVRSTLTQEEADRVEQIAKEYRMKGLSDEEAEAKAKADVKTLDEAGDKAWSDFIKRIQLGDVLDDSIRRQLIAYKKEAQKKGMEVDFKLDLSKKRIPNTIYIGSAVLTFSMKIEGVWVKVSEFGVVFDNDKEAKDEKSWKFQLYDAMLKSLVYNAIAHTIISYKYKKQNPTANESEPVRTEEKVSSEIQPNSGE
jgi:hypothetical protein